MATRSTCEAPEPIGARERRAAGGVQESASMFEGRVEAPSVPNASCRRGAHIKRHAAERAEQCGACSRVRGRAAVRGGPDETDAKRRDPSSPTPAGTSRLLLHALNRRHRAPTRRSGLAARLLDGPKLALQRGQRLAVRARRGARRSGPPLRRSSTQARRSVALRWTSPAASPPRPPRRRDVCRAAARRGLLTLRDTRNRPRR